MVPKMVLASVAFALVDMLISISSVVLVNVIIAIEHLARLVIIWRLALGFPSAGRR